GVVDRHHAARNSEPSSRSIRPVRSAPRTCSGRWPCRGSAWHAERRAWRSSSRLSGWVLYVRSFGMGLLKLLSFAGERVVDRVFEIGHLLEAAYGQLMLFEIVPDRFDARLLGTVPRQVDQMHVGRRQLGPRLGESLARVDGVVVQRDHQG